MTRARQYGFTADQMLGWLRLHLSPALPPVLEMAIRNWTGQASVFAGPVQLLHVPRPQARDAMLQSPLFASLLAATFPRIGLSSITTKRQRWRGCSHNSGLPSAMYVHYPCSRSYPRVSMTIHAQGDVSFYRCWIVAIGNGHRHGALWHGDSSGGLEWGRAN